jgi:cytochrome c553
MKNSIFLARFPLIVSVALVLLVFVPGSATALMSDHECDYCHSLHSAPGFTLLNQPSQANLVLTAELVCLSCHGPTGSSSLTADVHTNGGSSFPSNRISCIECHDAHDHQQNIDGVDNLNMVLGTITVMTSLDPINFPNDIDAVFADTDYSDGSYDYTKPDPWNGICQVCHTLTKNQRNDGTKSGHQLGTSCTASCHPHSNGFDK